MEEKYCPQCRKTIPLTKEFWHKNVASKDGYLSMCKKCRANNIKNQKGFYSIKAEKELTYQKIPQVDMKLGHKYKFIIPTNANNYITTKVQGEVIQINDRHITLRSRLGFAETFLKWDLDKWGFEEV